MSQPIRNNINYQKFISKELDRLLENLSIELDEYPVKEITSEYIVFVSMLDKETIFYKALSDFLTFDTISKIYDKLFLEIHDTLITVIKPGREIPFSDELNASFSKSYDIMKELGFELITSDVLFLSILSNNEKIKELFDSEGFSYEIAKDVVKRIHSNLAEISNVPELPKLDDNQQQVQIQIINPSDISSQGVSEMLSNMFGKSNQKNKKNGYISTYCTNLNELAERGKIDDLVGREDDIDTIVNIINRRNNNNVIIVGDSGVGKTHLVEGLAKKIVNRISPLSLINTTILKLNVSELMSGTNLRGMFEERIIGITKELSSKKNVILFIDDIHNYLTDKKKEEYDFGSLMNDLFTNSEVKVIATTTANGYKNLMDNNNELCRKFQRMTLLPPSYEENIKIINGIKNSYEEYHHVLYSDDAVKSCVKMSERYMSERSLPSSAIDILDESGSKKKLEIYDNEDIRTVLLNIDKLENEKKLAIMHDDIEKSNEINTKLEEENKKLSQFYDKLINDKSIRVVSDEDVCLAISKHTGVDVKKMSQDELKSLSEIDKNIRKEIIGQDEAIDLVTKSIKRSKVGLFPKDKPILTCMCIGSTGVGKTLLAKKLAKEVFGSEKNMLRFDMSEYSDKTSVNKLIGSSAGYVGYDKGGLLTEAVRNKKHTVLLIDEIEKADDSIYNLFLQIFDEGFLTDNSGNKVDFKNTIIILTSNVGAKRASSEKGIGFNVDENINRKSIIEKELKKKFPPEFINRLDNIVYFNSLNDDTLKKIIRLEMDKLNSRINDLGYNMTYDDNTVEYIFNIIEKEKDNGARPILRAIQDEIENRITDIIIETTKDIDEFIITSDINNIEISIK